MVRHVSHLFLIQFSYRFLSSETCIKGHRSSSCRHTDRPLFEIKKKGRPVTQCEHCRELRKTKQVHVKCLCESKMSESASLQGVLIYTPFHMKYDKLIDKVVLSCFCSLGCKSGFERAAFPDGLPKALETSVAFQTPADLSSSDSDHGGMHKVVVYPTTSLSTFFSVMLTFPRYRSSSCCSSLQVGGSL